MPRFPFPYVLLDGGYPRYSRNNTPIAAKTRFEKSLFRILSEAFGEESLPCCSADCPEFASRTVIVKADFDADVEEYEDFEEFYPRLNGFVYAIVPVCQACSNPSFNKDFRIDETDCILYNENGRDVSYRYIIHCHERLIINEEDPNSSYCLVCGETLDMMNYEDDIHNDDDESVSNPNLILWEH